MSDPWLVALDQAERLNPLCDECPKSAVGGEVGESGDVLWCEDHAPESGSEGAT